jgi:predicted Zn-dependent protease
VSDVNRSYVSWNGLYTHLGILTDLVQLNTYYLKSDSTSQRQNTATHELGHSLGLAHSLINNVMHDIQSTQTYLGTQDISDYDYLY